VRSLRFLWIFVVTIAAANDRIGGSAALTSDYRLYGLSQSNSEPALQAEIHYLGNPGARSSWFGGVWASTVRLSSRQPTSVQMEAFLGQQWALNADWQVRLAYGHYVHPWNSRLSRYDYDEFSASVAWRDALSFTAAWSPNTDLYSTYRGYAGNDRALNYELTGHVPVWRTLALVGGVGYRELQALFGTGYWYASAGLAYDGERMHLSLLRTGTDHTARDMFYSDSAEPAWIGTVLVTFQGH
jgi:uncharacterized protein (TIGR02001 family)